MFGQLTKLRPKVHTYDGQDYVRAFRKYDGHRIGVVSDRGVPFFFGRKSHELLLGEFDFAEALFKLPHGTILDGELFLPGGRSTDVPHYIAQEKPGLVYRVFGIYQWGDQLIRHWEDYDRICKEARFNVQEPEKMRDREELLNLAKELGIEGFVLKNGPSREWYKLKPTETVDAVVVCPLYGTGRNTYRVGSVEVTCRINGRLLAGTVKLQSAKDRIPFKSDAYVGRVLELQHEGITKHNRFKFARFMRWRDDKPAEECYQ